MYYINIYNALALSLRVFICYYRTFTEWKVINWRKKHAQSFFANKDKNLCTVFSLYGTLNALIIVTFISLSAYSHGRAAFSDPGFVPLPKKGIDFSDVKTNENNKVRRFLQIKSVILIWLFGFFLFLKAKCRRMDEYV